MLEQPTLTEIHEHYAENISRLEEELDQVKKELKYSIIIDRDVYDFISLKVQNVILPIGKQNADCLDFCQRFLSVGDKV